MGPYGRFMGRIKRGTRYVFRRRRGHGARRFLDTDTHAPSARGRHRPEPSARAQLVSLALPPLIVSFLGLLLLRSGPTVPHSLLLYLLVTVVLAVRALTASRAPRWIRWLAFAATLPFLVGVALFALGIWT
jgi:hypothetical protein